MSCVNINPNLWPNGQYSHSSGCEFASEIVKEKILDRTMTTPEGLTASVQKEVQDINAGCEAIAKSDEIAVFKSELLKKVDEHNHELEKMESEQAQLAIFRNELMEKVDEHLQDRARMEAEQTQLSLFKNELMGKVDEHLEEIKKSEDKAAEVAKMKESMLEKVNLHARNVGLRASF